MGWGLECTHCIYGLLFCFFCLEQVSFRNHSGTDSTNKKTWVSPGGTCSMKRPSIDVCRTGWHDIWVNLEGKRVEELPSNWKIQKGNR